MGLFFSVRGSSPMERVIRSIAMVLVILAVIWAFWKNNENVIEQLQENQSFWDETGQADAGLKGFVRGFADTFEKEFGIEARVQVRSGEIPEPHLDDGELYLGISPARQRAVLRVEPESEADRELVEYVEREHFGPYWDSGWAEGLESALVMIWSHYSGESEGFLDRVAAQTAVEDRTGTLSTEDLAFAARFAAALSEDFGQKAVIVVFEGPVVVPALDSRTLFIGVSPSASEALVSLPPLIERALPEGFANRLTLEHFPAAFERGEWQRGLKESLVMIWKALAGETMEQGQ